MPRATYRVQLNAGFTFDDAAAVTAYLARLGVSHVYCSPYLKAAAGSMHGYDVTDHSRINDELGGEAGHGRFVRSLADEGLGHVVDVVPNHMAISDASNAWWWDVLRNGPSSRYAGYFDIDWDPTEAVLHRTILVPILLVKLILRTLSRLTSLSSLLNPKSLLLDAQALSSLTGHGEYDRPYQTKPIWGRQKPLGTQYVDLPTQPLV